MPLIFKEGYFLGEAAAIKKEVQIPVIAVGGFRSRDKMEQALIRGDADFIALSRPFIRQPNLVKAMKKSKDANPITCVNCNLCTVEITGNYKALKCFYRPGMKL